MSTRDDLLAEMARLSAARARRARRPARELLEHGLVLPPPPPLRLVPGKFELIAEIKFASPSAGALAPRPSARAALEQAGVYAAAGARAVSVLTEPTRFGGSLAHLEAAAHAGPPVMRKDFLVDPVQVAEARLAGASGVLLVLRLLDREALEALLAACGALRMFALLEAFDERDLERARDAAELRGEVQLLIGVNARDLATLRVEPERCLRLAPLLPPDVPAVAESGIERPEDARAVADAGYSLALVGSALMRARDPGCLLRGLLEAGRAASRGRSAR